VMVEPGANAPGQLWSISYPQSEVHRVTNDLTNYDLASLDITRDAKMFVAVQATIHQELWAAPNGDSDHATLIPFNGEPVRIALAGSDHLVIQDLHGQVFTMHLNGSGQTPLLTDHHVQSPTDCGPGSALVFSESLDDNINVWKADADGGNAVQLTHQKRAIYPNCAPDGKSFAYWQTPNLFLQDITASSPTTKLDPLTPNGRVRFSPDGKTIAAIGFVPGPPERRAFVLGPLDSSKPRYLFQNVPLGTNWLDWSPDGKALDYTALRAGATNVWRQPIDGSPSQQLTRFTTPELTSFRWSPDAKTLYVVRGTRSADIVLFRETK
jgi:Tol biopolymer transport system component